MNRKLNVPFVFHWFSYHSGVSLYWIPSCHDNQSHSSTPVVLICLFQEMILELKAFAARSEHQTSDSTFLVFMSHGIRAGICGKKYSEEVPDILKVDDIFQILNTGNCPALKDKPKVIIIQACRGGECWCLSEHRALKYWFHYLCVSSIFPFLWVYSSVSKKSYHPVW